MSTFFQRVRICVALIEKFGIKRVLLAARESRGCTGSPIGNMPPAPAFRRYQVFQ